MLEELSSRNLKKEYLQRTANISHCCLLFSCDITVVNAVSNRVANLFI